MRERNSLSSSARSGAADDSKSSEWGCFPSRPPDSISHSLIVLVRLCVRPPCVAFFAHTCTEWVLESVCNLPGLLNTGESHVNCTQIASWSSVRQQFRQKKEEDGGGGWKSSWLTQGLSVWGLEVLPPIVSALRLHHAWVPTLKTRLCTWATSAPLSLCTSSKEGWMPVSGSLAFPAELARAYRQEF